MIQESSKLAIKLEIVQVQYVPRKLGVTRKPKQSDPYPPIHCSSLGSLLIGFLAYYLLNLGIIT